MYLPADAVELLAKGEDVSPDKLDMGAFAQSSPLASAMFHIPAALIQERPIILCEYAHAMENSLGNFKEYWEVFKRHDNIIGAFIWDFVDQSIRCVTDSGEEWLYGGDFGEEMLYTLPVADICLPPAAECFLNLLEYMVHPAGRVRIRHTATPLAQPYRIGMTAVLPEELYHFTWYGRGPHETYCDRKSGADVSCYSAYLDELGHDYMRPQENGNRTDVRFLTGFGLLKTPYVIHEGRTYTQEFEIY